VGILVGSCDVGRNVGLGDGMREGVVDGAGVGITDGNWVGAFVGSIDGLGLGELVGKAVGFCVGVSVSNISHVSKLLDISTMKGSCVTKVPLEYSFQSYCKSELKFPFMKL